MKEIWTEFYHHGDSEEEMDVLKAALDKRFNPDEELFNFEKPFYMAHIGMEGRGFIAYFDLFENEEFAEEDDVKKNIETLISDYSELFSKYRISSVWHGISLSGLEESCIAVGMKGEVSEMRSYSFLPAVKEYGEEDFSLFLENLRACAKGTPAEDIYGDFSHLESLEELFRDFHSNENDELLINLFFWMKNRFPQIQMM